LNVSNFHTTEENIGYGTEISIKLGGAPFVIDTSRNGNGPPKGDAGDGPSFCNPPGAGVVHQQMQRTGPS
jgi:endoglucanase